jgi:soluble cytochrome b562
MPRTQREMMLRRIDQARSALEKSVAYLLEMRAVYDPDYPDYVEGVDSAIVLIDEAHQVVEALGEIV